MHTLPQRQLIGEFCSSVEKGRARLILNAIRLVAGCSIVTAIAGINPAEAQAPADPPDTNYAMGLVPPSADQVANFSKAPELKAAGIPRKMDLSAFLPPVGNQGRQGSCVAWSSGYGMRSYYVAKMDRLNVSLPQNVPSPAYIYNHARGLFSNCTTLGMQVFYALDILKAGVVSLAEMPYNDAICSPQPDVEMQKKATKFRIQAWQFIHPSRLDQIKAQLSDGQPVVFGTKLAQSFLRFRGPGVYSRSQQEPLLDGGHAMVLIGYDDDRKAFRLQNSWGTGWGDQGRAWLSYDTFYHGPDGGDATDSYIIYAAPAFH